MDKLTGATLQRMFNEHFNREMIVKGLAYYLKVKEEEIQIFEKYNNLYFTNQIDDKVRLQLIYSAGTHYTDFSDEEWIGIKGKSLIQLITPPKDRLDAYDLQKQADQVYGSKFKKLFTFLYLEMMQLKIDILSKGYNSKDFWINEDFFYKSSLSYNGSYYRKLESDPIAWKTFVANKRVEYSPIKFNNNEYRKIITKNSPPKNSLTQNSGCLIYFTLSIGIITMLSWILI
ncbi:hypothetical protein ACFVSW_27380 [Neobacillus sp. NPDC058068]|uniref:hypothetical protein n=1 Tax=Neobacillus sp. NPDC058068 TaxID=3346325 RepID=UPI0036D794C9